MYRFLPLLLVFAAAACGGGGAAPETPTSAAPPATNTMTQEVAGARTATPATPTAEPTPPGTYTVVEGDTLSEIAARFNTTVDDLVALNQLTNADEITIGLVLKVSAAAAGTTTTATPQ